MFNKIFLAISITVAVSLSSYAAKVDPQIILNSAGSDYASVLNKIALAQKFEPDNAAPIYLKAFELYKAEPVQIYGLRIWQGWPNDMKDEHRGFIDEWLKANQPALEKLKEGSRMPFFWLTYPKDIPIGTGPLSTYTQVNSLANAMCWQAKVKAADGMVADAFDDMLTVYRFGRQIAEAPHTLAEQTTGFTIQISAMWTAAQIIAHAKPDNAALVDLQKVLEAMHNEQNFNFDLTAAQLWIQDAADRTFTKDGGISKLHLDAMQRSLNLSADDMSRWQNLNKAQTISQSRELFSLLESKMKKSPWELKKEGISIAAQINQLTGGNILLESYRPDIGSNADLPARCKAQIEAVITICAAKRYAAEHNTMPPTLKVLEVSGYLSRIPLDPYRNGPMSYVDAASNFRLYSWGVDCKDNFARPSKWGEGQNGGDEVFWPVL